MSRRKRARQKPPSERRTVDKLIDPEPHFMHRVELFPDDPRDPIPEAIRSAHVQMETGRIFLAAEFVGTRKIQEAIDSKKCPPGDIPVCVADGITCIAIDWLAKALPVYDRLWLKIHKQVVAEWPDHLPPPIPPQADKLRDAHKVVNPHQVFRLELGPGEIMETTGADLIATADAFVALVDAQRAGDERAMRKAVERIEDLP